MFFVLPETREAIETPWGGAPEELAGFIRAGRVGGPRPSTGAERCSLVSVLKDRFNRCNYKVSWHKMLM